MELHCGAIKTLKIERRSPPGGDLTGTAEVAFYTKADAMTCIEASRKGEMYIHATPIRAELVEQVTEKPEAPQQAGHSSVQANSAETNTGESALRTSDTTDKTTENQENQNTEDHAKPSGTQYKVLLSNIHPRLGHYTRMGPEKRASTPAAECLLGTAEVAFANQKTLQKCIRASPERFLFLFGRNLHARAI